MTAVIEHWSGLEQVADQFRLVICDLWGVVHDGIRLNRPAVGALENLMMAGVDLVFLSNAPRPRYEVRAHLSQMGLKPDMSEQVITSGGLARDAVRATFAGAALFHLGPDDDGATVRDLPVDRVHNIDDADIIMATDIAPMPLDKHREYFHQAVAKGAIFLCANPDRIVHMGDRLIACAGAAADIYKDMGGHVRWFGKPTQAAARSCLVETGNSDTPSDKVLVIGDSLQTDIEMAWKAGFKSLLIESGIHRDDMKSLNPVRDKEQDLLSHVFLDHFGEHTPIPDARMGYLKW